MKKWLFLLPVLALLISCTTPYPLNMTESQWNKLTAEERKLLLLEQQRYREEQRLAKIKADARAKELKHIENMAEKRRLEKLYQNPYNGNVIMVNILRGHYKYDKKLQYIQEDTFQLARGESKHIRLRLKDSKKGYITTKSAYLKYEINGNAVYLYLKDPKYGSKNRVSLLRDGKWHCGSHYRKELDTTYEKLRDFRLFVKEIGTHCDPVPVIDRRKIY